MCPLIRPPRLVPGGFEAPTRASFGSLVAVPLQSKRFVLDYESYMSSVAHLQGTFRTQNGPFEAGEQAWPAGTTLETAYLEAAWTEMEWLLGSSYTYVILTPDKTQQIGCAYIWPSRKEGYDVDCQSWVRADRLEAGTDRELHTWFQSWVKAAWPLDPSRVAWPGRDIPWETWGALPER